MQKSVLAAVDEMRRQSAWVISLCTVLVCCVVNQSASHRKIDDQSTIFGRQKKLSAGDRRKLSAANLVPLFTQTTPCFAGRTCTITCQLPNHTNFRNGVRFIRDNEGMENCSFEDYPGDYVHFEAEISIAACLLGLCYTTIPTHYSFWPIRGKSSIYTLNIISFNSDCDEGLWYCEDSSSYQRAQLMLKPFERPRGNIYLHCLKYFHLGQQLVRLSCRGLEFIGNPPVSLIIQNLPDATQLFWTTGIKILSTIKYDGSRGYRCAAFWRNDELKYNIYSSDVCLLRENSTATAENLKLLGFPYTSYWGERWKAAHLAYILTGFHRLVQFSLDV